MEYKLRGIHPQDIASGRMLEPGETVELDEENLDPFDQLLIDAGILIAMKDLEEPKATEAALQAASDQGVPIGAVEGTGASGRITKEDVDRYVATQGEGGDS